MNIVWISLVLLLAVSSTYTSSSSSSCLCSTHRRCGDCIRSGCAWCADPGFSRGFQGRCMCPDGVSGCSDLYPKKLSEEEQVTVMEDNHFDSKVQLKPQKVVINMHVGETVELKLNYKAAENYPVDLYYLMDLSYSMEVLRDALWQNGRKLAHTMRNLTNSFRLGFGSFVDKPIEPWFNASQFETETCKKMVDKDPKCIKPYSFKHHMNLSDNDARFTEEVKHTMFSTNVDSPEGVFDAVMQAVVCQKEIGWRDDARHLLIVSTDASFHFAGDGRLLGLYIPNDMKCHLDHNGMYTEATRYDYPSISQINSAVVQNYVNLIFVVKERLNFTYTLLNRDITDSSVLVLTEDSSNLVQLIEAEYEKIMDNVMLGDSANQTVLTVNFNSSCKGYIPATRKCTIGHHEEVEYTVQVKAEMCPANRSDWKQSFDIFVPKLKDKVHVEVNLLCECPCEVQGTVPNADECSGEGTLQCGICECGEDYVGSHCQCARANTLKDVADCKPRNASESELLCSGNGVCECGICNCTERYSGEFCQCDNYNCPQDAHENICSGHGTCMCGICNCYTGWDGMVCSCPTSKDLCVPPGGGSPCSGNGDCHCGECKCHGKYTGKFCDKCTTCQGKKCEAYKEYIHKQVFEVECSSEEKCVNPGIDLVLLDRVEASDDDRQNGIEFCQFIDDDDCYYYFRYFEGNITVEVQRTKVCKEGVDVLALVLGLIAGIVLLGLLLLIIWKVVTTIHDQKEFAKFEKERRNAKWDTGENPLYKNATTTFVNPTFRKE